MNVFIQLSKWASRQGENFATDALAVTLSNLLERDPEIGLRVLYYITNGLYSENDPEISTIEISTQKNDEGGHGQPDMWIQSSSKLALIEVKAGATLGKNQLKNYRAILKDYPEDRVKLILLTQYLTSPGKHHPDFSLRWYQLAQFLAEDCDERTCTPESHFLVQQLLEFLRARNLAFPEVKSEISKAVIKHEQVAGEKALTKKRVKSLTRLRKYEELKPLHDLLLLMGSVLDSMEAVANPRLDSGQQTGGWIGYNIDGMKHWLCLYYSSPDVLVFESKIRKGEHLPHRVPSIGKYYSRWKNTWWMNQLDLSVDDGKFFRSSPETQFETILDFTKKSMDQAGQDHYSE